jgi:hypothetical protein
MSSFKASGSRSASWLGLRIDNTSVAVGVV